MSVYYLTLLGNGALHLESIYGQGSACFIPICPNHHGATPKLVTRFHQDIRTYTSPLILCSVLVCTYSVGKMLTMDRVEELIPFMQNPPVDMYVCTKAPDMHSILDFSVLSVLFAGWLSRNLLPFLKHLLCLEMKWRLTSVK